MPVRLVMAPYIVSEDRKARRDREDSYRLVDLYTLCPSDISFSLFSLARELAQQIQNEFLPAGEINFSPIIRYLMSRLQISGRNISL